MLRQHRGELAGLQRAHTGVRSRDPNHDDVVPEPAIRQNHRLPLLWARGLVLVQLSRSSVHELDAAGSGRDLPGLWLRRRHAGAQRGRGASGMAVRPDGRLRVPHRDAHAVPAAVYQRPERSRDGVAGHPLGDRAPDLSLRTRDRRGERRCARGQDRAAPRHLFERRDEQQRGTVRPISDGPPSRQL